MVKQLTKGKEWLNNAYWSAVGMATATMLTMQPVLATATGTGTIWARFSTILKDVYGQIVAISTIVAVTVAAIALLVRMISRTEIEKTGLRRKVKDIYVKEDQFTVRIVRPSIKLRSLNVGDRITIYLADNAPVYEMDGCKVICNTLAVEKEYGS